MESPRRGDPGFGVALVAPLALGSLLNPINSSMIATALAPIGRSLGVGVSETVWLVAALYVASSVAQPTMGKLADRWGARRIFVFGLVLVLLGGLAGTFAPTFAALVVVRIILGIGTSAAYPCAMTILRTRSRRLGRETPRPVLGVLSLAALSSAAAGPTLGGVLTGAAGWRATFAVNVPLAAIGIVLCLAFVEADAPGDSNSSDASIDVTGIALFAGAVVFLMLFVMGLKTGVRWWLLPMGAGSLLALLVHSRRRAVLQPFLDVRMLAANKALSATYVRFGLACVLSYVMFYGFAQWLEDALGYSSTAAGLATLPLSLTAAISALLGAQTKTLRAPLVISAFALLAGFAGLLFLGDHASYFAIGAVGAVFGVGQGTAFVANQTAVYEQSPPSAVGTAAGLQRTAGYLGAVGASSLLAFFYESRASTAGLHSLALTMLVLGAFLCAFTVLDPSLQGTKKRAE